ncbi:MAG: HepT-like ribonuclease domain-containing protein [Bacillota bacterium]
MAGRRLNRDRVETYLSRMDEAVARLAALRKRFASDEEFEADVDTRELGGALPAHRAGVVRPRYLSPLPAAKAVSLTEFDRASLIELAGDRGLLDPGFARKIRGMAGMRNAIVYVYRILHYRAIYEAVTQRLATWTVRPAGEALR